MKIFRLFIEFLYFIPITLFITFFYIKDVLYKGIVPIIVSFFIYGVLSFAFYISFKYKNNNKKNNAEINLPKIIITDELKNEYINLRFLFIGLSKIIIAFLPPVLFFLSEIMLLRTFIVLLSFVFLFVLFFLFIIFVIRYHMLSEGYTNLTFINTIKHGLFYYNENDKRAIVDKPFGAGSTINFASKQGRLVFYVLISIPITIIVILITVFSYK